MTPGNPQYERHEGTAVLQDEVLERSTFGGGQTVTGVAAVAAFVALPTGMPLSDIVGRWVPPVVVLSHEVPVAVVMTAIIWVGMVAWLLHGVQAYLASTRRAVEGVSRRSRAPRALRRRPSTHGATPLAAA